MVLPAAASGPSPHPPPPPGRRRFAYTSHPLIQAEMEKQMSNPQMGGDPSSFAQFGPGASYASYPHPVKKFPHSEDALSTIMQWLYDRIDKTR